MNAVHNANPQFSLTTPLYYVNDVPHIGSAYTTLIADAIARWHRLKGEKVLLITGTDEHGQKIQRTAEQQGLSPQDHCDRVVEKFIFLWEKLNIQWDRFSRTTAEKHHSIVQQFFQRVWDQGDIYLSQQQGWYCVACEEFKEKRDLTSEGHCPIHVNIKAEWRDEENYFFRLSKYQGALEKLYSENPDFIQPESRRNEVINFVKQGLQDFSISRINLDWGFPIPSDPRHTIYVWFDALLGYITALLDPEDEPTLENALKQWFPINLHLIGKDILRFHAIYWPAMLMSADLPLPPQVFGHGFLTKDGRKMGKTLGNTLDPLTLIEKYGPDAVRYYFIKEVELGQDGDFNETRFVTVLNADLANDLGNLLNRTLGMVKKYCQGQVPPLTGADLEEINPLKTIGESLTQKVSQGFDRLEFHHACEAILALIRASNKYIDDSAPWSLFKQNQHQEVAKVLYSVLESVRLSAYLLSPIIPNLSNSIYQQLGLSADFNTPSSLENNAPFSLHSQWGKMTVTATLSQGKPIFARLELPESSL